MRSLLLVAAAVSFLGCAAAPGVVQTGPMSYTVGRQAATGFTGLGALRADALREANSFCAKKNKVIQVLATTESAPPYILGNYPRVDIEFTCADIPE